jgi:two-component system KDP operon response regulator KdpE
VSLVLVVDDEPQILRTVGLNLKARGYDVESAASGEEALKIAASRPPDLVILDLGLPGVDGVEVISELREWSRVPVIVLSVRDLEAQKVAALEAGADDYVTKPFGMAELIARVRAALRRSVSREGETVVETDDFAVDLEAKVVTRDGEEVHLTPTEWRMLEVLVVNEGSLVTQADLLREIWGPNYKDETNYLRVFMSQVRSKLEPDPSHPRYFVTEPGMGYRFRSS